MDLSEREKGILKRIITDQAYELLERIQVALSEQWSKPPLEGETSFQIAKESLKRQERDEGVKLFLKTIQQLCQ